MNKYVIEREIPDVEKSSQEDLINITNTSNEALNKLGTDIQWLHSYVADGKIFCVYVAKNEDLIRKHGEMGGFPVDKIRKVRAVIDPATANTEILINA